MRMRVVPVVLGVAALAAATSPASAERLVASLSTHRVMITSNFTGEELVLFGGIEQDSASGPRRGGYDIVVTVTGPRQSTVTFRKQRMLAIWVNADSRVFEDAPSYLAVLSNRPRLQAPRRCAAFSSALTTFPCRNARASTSQNPAATSRSGSHSSRSRPTTASTAKWRTA